MKRFCGSKNNWVENWIMLLLYPYVTLSEWHIWYSAFILKLPLWTQNSAHMYLWLLINRCDIMTWLESQSSVDCWCFIWYSLRVCLRTVKAGFLTLSTVRWNLNDEQKHRRLSNMENLATGLVFIIVVVNVFITAFGVHRPNRSDWPRKHTGTLSVYLNHICSLFSHCVSAPVLLFRLVFSLLPYGAVCPYRHPCSQHVFGASPVLTWPSQPPYLTYKHTALSRLT